LLFEKRRSGWKYSTMAEASTWSSPVMSLVLAHLARDIGGEAYFSGFAPARP
jgi:hypothetical protein